MNKRVNRPRVIHVITSLRIGGTETLLCDLVQRLQETHEQHVIYFHDGPNRTRLEAMGIPVYQVRGLLCMYDPIFLWRLWRVLKKIQPNVIHTLLWSANLLGSLMARLLGVPSVCAVHHRPEGEDFVRRALDKLTWHAATSVVAVSRNVAAAITQRTAKRIHKKVCLVRNALDAHEIVARGQAAGVSRADLELADTHVIIGCVGRFVVWKNVPLVLRAFTHVLQLIPNARLVLVGVGPQEHALKKLAHTLGVWHAVRFVVGKNAIGYYPLFDCFVLGSKDEPFGLVLLEAMAFGVPCIATTSAVIEHEKNGLVVPLDETCMADAICRILTDQPFAQQLSQAGRSVVAHEFCFQTMVTSYANLFDQ